MNISAEAKQLIADGKTQKAIDWLKAFLQDKDKDLLNQTYLLESQFKDLLKKQNLDIQDTDAGINRIKNTLLLLCDEVDKLGFNTSIGDSNNKGDSALKVTGIVFGIIALIIIVLLYFVFTKGDNISTKIQGSNNSIVEKTATTVSKNKNWQIVPTTSTVRYRYYGNIQIDILSVSSQAKDADNQILTVKLKLLCKESYSATCIANYLEYRLVKPNGDKLAPNDTPQYPNNGLIKDGTSGETSVSFDIPNTMEKGSLEIYYTGQEKETLVRLDLK